METIPREKTYFGEKLETIISAIQGNLPDDAINYLRDHLYNQLAQMEYPQIIVNNREIKIFANKEAQNNKVLCRFINFSKGDDNWSIEIGEKFIETKNGIKYTDIDAITYYLGNSVSTSKSPRIFRINQGELLVAEEKTTHMIENCGVEKKNSNTSIWYFENNSWQLKYVVKEPERGSYFSDNLTASNSARKRLR